MTNSNDVASNEMLWERVLSLLVVEASVLGGSTVLLTQALPPILHGFPWRRKRILSSTRTKSSGEGVSNETSNESERFTRSKNDFNDLARNFNLPF
jgi:hypothetical protein